MNKKQKRELGEARQAQFAQEARESGLKAQRDHHKAVQKRKETLEKIEARKQAAQKALNASAAMREVGESASKASKSMTDFVAACKVEEELEVDYPEVLDMTDESYAS